MKILLIKLSGKVLHSPLLPLLLKEIDKHCKHAGSAYMLVHGGGNFLTRYCESRGLTPSFDAEGNRITGSEEMEAAQRILAGQLRTQLVHQYRALGISAVGISASDGSLLEAVPAPSNADAKDQYTGSIVSCNAAVLQALLAANFVPVINSVACDAGGKALNINADDLASALAAEMQLPKLVFLSDTEGITHGTSLIKKLNRRDVEKYIKMNAIHSGMLKKVKMSMLALKKGVKEILIGNYTQKGDLEALILHKRGTLLYEG